MRIWRPLTLILLLPALALACSLTASPVAGNRAGAMQPASTPVQINLEGAAQSAPDQASPTPVPTPESCIVIADVLQLRACAGTHCTVLDWLEQGEELTVLESGKRGYIKLFLALKNEESPEAVSQL